MQTAVIISGIVREMDNAINTWFFPGDYFLFAQKEYQRPRSDIVEHNILSSLTNHLHKFQSISLVSRLDNIHPTLNMAWKWKVAFHHLQPYIKQHNYTQFIITRPDFYFLKYKDWDLICTEPDTLYSTSIMVLDSMGMKFVNDSCMACNYAVFEKLSKFYDYYADKAATLNIHVHLSNYLENNNITVNAKLLEYSHSFPLRSNTREMFTGGVLDNKYSVNDLITKGQQWNSGDQND